MKGYFIALMIIMLNTCMLMGMAKEEYEHYNKEFEEVSLVNIENLIQLCSKALRKKRPEKIKTLLSPAGSQSRRENTATSERDSLLTPDNNEGFTLTENDKRRLATILLDQLRQRSQQQQTASFCSRHFNTRTITGVLGLAVAAGGYYGTYSDECNTANTPWFCTFLRTAAASVSAFVGIYQLGNDFNQTDATHERNETMALELQVTNILRDHGISDTIFNELRKIRDAEDALRLSK